MGRAGLPWFHPVERSIASRPGVCKFSLIQAKLQTAFPLHGPGGLVQGTKPEQGWWEV